MNGFWLILLAVFAAAGYFFAPRLFGFPRLKKVRYKTTPQGDLWLHIYMPPRQAAKPPPALLYFYGGGWVEGRVSQFQTQARHMAKAGVVVALAQYRVSSREGTAPDSAVEDAFDAFAYLLDSARDWNVDPQRIAIGGSSAGGHLAACVSLCQPPHELQLKTRPAIMLLLNPVLDLYTVTAELEFTCGEIALVDELERKGLRQQLSPQQQSFSKAPPTYMLYGSEDPLKKQGEYFTQKMLEHNKDVQSVSVPGQRHSFFNHPPHNLQVADELLLFLRKQGWV
ncbi:MAG: hypothetical protein CSA53_01375 [Gammaproteobacteria bacterium]|nr:MAG: hypothetical protein CSA53_01375 [Gammaproteobacteria bacterium]